MNGSEPQSPCVSICQLDDNDICQGCFRSADEITDWVMVGAGEKREILGRAAQRREAATTIRLR